IVCKANATTTQEEVIALRDHLRQSVRWEEAERDKRPFLRDSARETLESGLGYCGESTRAFISLARQRQIYAQRVNLYGRVNHVVAEVMEPDGDFLVDAQKNKDTNWIFDQRPWGVEELLLAEGMPFDDYSNLHLRRAPVLGPWIQRVKLRN